MLFVIISLLLLIFVHCVYLFVFSLINVCFDMFCIGFIPTGHSGIFHFRWLFPFPFLGSFQPLSPQIFSHALSFCLLSP